MKRIILATLISLSFSGLANANSGVYTSLKAGISDTKYKNSKDRLSYNYDDYQASQTFKNDNQTKSIYPNISAAVGFDFSQISKINARAELEYTYKDSATFSPTIDSGEFREGDDVYELEAPDGIRYFNNKLKTQSLMLNGYYDFKNQSKFTPYVGAGVGVTRIKNTRSLTDMYSDSSEGFSSNANHFTWSAGVGVAYSVTNNVALDLSYKYVDAGKFKFKNDIDGTHFDTKANLSSQDYSLGIRYTF